MNNKLLISLTLLLSLLSFTSCNNKPNNDNNKQDENKEETTKGIDLTGYTSNIPNASEIGIAYVDKENKQELSNTSETNDFEQNTVVFNEHGDNEENVELYFEKLVYDKNGKDIKDSKRIIAISDDEELTMENNATISFRVDDGFKYSLYYSKTAKNPIIGFEDIKDGSLHDDNPKEHYVTLSGLVNYHPYYLHCEGIGYKLHVNQNELDFVVSNIYSAKGLTFIQFTDKRFFINPNIIGYRGNLFDFNTMSFNSNSNSFRSNEHFERAYVIDNKTGYIYLIKDYNLTVYRDLISASEQSIFDITHEHVQEDKVLQSGIYDYFINENDEFELKKIFDTTRNFSGKFFKDKYNRNFISNKFLDKYDPNTNSVYYKCDNNVRYYLTSNNETLKISLNENHITDVKLVNENNELIDLPRDTEFEIVRESGMSGYASPFYYKNGEVYYATSVTNYLQNRMVIGKFDVHSKKDKSLNINANLNGTINVYNDAPIESASRREIQFNPCYLLKGLGLIYNDRTLYTIKNIFETIDYLTENEIYSIKFKELPNLEVFLEDCEYDSEEVAYKTITIYGNIYYHVCVEKDINDGYCFKKYEYAEFKKLHSLVLQPINN